MIARRTQKQKVRKEETSSESESEQEEQDNENSFRKRLHKLIVHCKDINSTYRNGKNIPEKNKVTKGIKRIAILSVRKELVPVFAKCIMEFVEEQRINIENLSFVDVVDKDQVKLIVGKRSDIARYSYLPIGHLLHQAKSLDSDSKDDGYSYVQYLYLYLYRVILSAIEVTEERVQTRFLESIKATVKRLEDSLEDDEDEDDEQQPGDNGSLDGIVKIAGKVMEQLGVDTGGKIPSTKDFESTVQKLFNTGKGKKKIEDSESE